LKRYLVGMIYSGMSILKFSWVEARDGVWSGEKVTDVTAQHTPSRQGVRAMPLELPLHKVMAYEAVAA
jgi:hypothetical protein